MGVMVGKVRYGRDGWKARSARYIDVRTMNRRYNSIACYVWCMWIWCRMVLVLHDNDFTN